MGLTSQSSGLSLLKAKFNIQRKSESQIVIALAGNPNTGKSTLFNHLTGLNQHTGNWPGKTVANAQGTFTYKDKEFLLVDLPGTYSILASSVEEEVARDFICFGNPNLTIVITDATCLERNLNLALQVMEITDNVIVCLNLMDEAERKGIYIDLKKLQEFLGVPVIPTVAKDGKGVDELLEVIHQFTENKLELKPYKVKYEESIETLVTQIEEKLTPIISDIFNTRWIGLRLLDGDEKILSTINSIINDSYEGGIDDE
ncbi:Fe2+ transport system protein B [Gottschalkia purinilytica]|uniref:Fe2+ transport system protein B n=1 Tax=Gottschalkia purinilytica TaxID=1503 RepID=A0A0L0W9H0_GOTPU|nr:FeoB small GTPase domain-containing protein [Gottschalkia purinilytica]KNF08086.1 Fe2+ transport system protein B [Gottschalkia purinilytica]